MTEIYTNEDIQAAIKAIDSSLRKCEKARTKLAEGTAQLKYIDRQLAAYHLALPLLEKQLSTAPETSAETSHEQSPSTGDQLNPHSSSNEANEEFVSAAQTALSTYEHLIEKCEKLLPKFDDGTPQKTLAIRRLAAFRMAIALISAEQEVSHG